MRHTLLAVLPLALALAGCGKSEQASTPATQEEAAPAATPATAEAPAAAEETLVYEPIDAGKLPNQWWEQFSK
jgi:hypothetical protein